MFALSTRYVVYRLGSDRPNNDELAYCELAGSIASGEGLTRAGVAETHIHPLFPMLQAVPVAVGADVGSAGRWVGLVSSAAAAPASVWLVWGVLGCLRRQARGADRLVGWVAGLLVCVHPRLLVTAERIQPVGLAAVLLILFVACWVRKSWWNMALVASLGFLARPELAILLPAGLLVILLDDRRAWRRMAGPALLALALSAPWLLHLKAATGEWALTGKVRWTYAMARLEGEESVLSAKDVAAAEETMGRIGAHVLEDPMAATAGYFGRLVEAVGHIARALYLPLFALAGLGLWLLRRSSAGGPILVALSPVMLLPLGAVQARHALVWTPFLLAVAVAGLSFEIQRRSAARIGSS